MDAAEVGHHHSTDHDVVKMRDDKIGVVQMHIDRQGCQKQTRETADGEEPDETEGVKHRRVKGDRAFV